MKTDSIVQTIPLSGRKRSLIEDARRDRESGSSSPGPSRCGDSFVFEEEKSGKVTLNILFALRNEKNAGFFKAGKVFEVRAFTLVIFIHKLSCSIGGILFRCLYRVFPFIIIIFFLNV